MAETATKATTTPRRTRTPAKPAVKPAAKAAPAKAAPEPEAAATVKVAFAVAKGDETKSYQKFDLSKDLDGNATGCVGTVYAPLGTMEVKIQLVGPADVIDAE